MNNINYSIAIDNIRENQILDTELLLNELNNSLEIKEIIINNNIDNNKYSISEYNQSEYNQSENDFINYYTYYNVKDLHKILDYYSLPKTKLKKDELIQMIVLYENDFNNYEIVQRRKLMWHYIEELKNDEFMKKYILF
jgi:hypothetical protein